ncbi:MAG: hypothetical protein ACTSUT_14460 [Promethearchaeota archaeon]
MELDFIKIGIYLKYNLIIINFKKDRSCRIIHRVILSARKINENPKVEPRLNLAMLEPIITG